MTQPEKASQNGENAKGVQKQNAKASANRFSSDYWEERVYRPTYTRDGKRTEVSQYFVQIAHAGQRHAVQLASNNKEEAARNALKLFKTLKRDGWDAALRLFRKDEPINKDLTVGKYLGLVDDYTTMPTRTLANYSYALRRIAGDIAGAKMEKGANRFDPAGKWRNSVDGIPLAKVTPVAVEGWRTAFIKARKGDAVKEQRAVRSTNSFIRNARALFSRNILELMKKKSVELPTPLPFDGVRMAEGIGSTRYRSQIDASKLLNAARVKFAESDPDAYAVILLAQGAGLRRSEIDKLQWQNVMPDRGIIRVMTTAQGGVKSDDSDGDIFVDAGLFAELERTRRPGSTLYVVQPNTEHRKTKAAQYYRADKTFKKALSWLRTEFGITDLRPIHAMRKEFGSVVASEGDIHQAQRQLRHAQISTTEQFYADGRKRATVAVGAMLNESKKAEAV